MKFDFISKTIIAAVVVALPIYAQTPEEDFQDEEIFDQDILLEEEDYDDWSDLLDEYYVPVGMEGPIQPEEPPSILDSGTYNTQMAFDNEYLEKSGVNAVTIQ